MGLDAYITTVDADIEARALPWREAHNSLEPSNRCTELDLKVYDAILQHHRLQLFQRTGLDLIDEFNILAEQYPEYGTAPYNHLFLPAINLAINLGLYDPRFMYYRKHYVLHDAMQAHFVRHGGSPEPDAFNCTTLTITAADLDELDAALMAKPLALSSRAIEEFASMAGIYAKFRKQINLGKTLTYWAWY